MYIWSLVPCVCNRQAKLIITAQTSHLVTRKMFPSTRPFLGLQGTALSWAITCCSASAFLLFGYDQGIMGSIISTPYFLEAVNIRVRHLQPSRFWFLTDVLKATDADTISTVVSIYDIGCSESFTQKYPSYPKYSEN